MDPNIERQYSPYTDINRVPAPSNLTRLEITTGAFMTWLQHESLFPDWFLALSGPENGQRIVLDKNDVDCVVNANVIRTLTVRGKTSAYGYQDACRLVHADAVDYEFNYCGDYYPDTYWLHYATARAYQDGATCLESTVGILRDHLMKKQQPDGRWVNRMLDNDDVLATAFALGALVKTGDPRDPDQLAAVDRGVAFLLRNKKTNEHGYTYWPGGTFFSAGVPARYAVRWYSNAFTTSVITLLLYDLKRWLPAKESCEVSEPVSRILPHKNYRQ